MTANKINFNNLLINATRLAIAAMSVLIVCNCINRIEVKLHRKITDKFSVTIVRDTINAGYTDELPKVSLCMGKYNPLSNDAVIYAMRDTTGNQKSRNVVAQINRRFKYTDYHELRHAYNRSLHIRSRDSLNARSFALDEISARCAQYLAKYGEMPPIPAGRVPINVNYTIPKNIKLRRLADVLLSDALEDVLDNNYVYDFFVLPTQTALYPKMALTMRADLLEREMLTFQINGRPVYLLNRASPEIRDVILEYLDVFRER